jgi:ABC-type phosphate transport system substrate-binding protein
VFPGAAVRVWVAIAAVLLLASASAPAAPQLTFRIIVHRDNPVSALTLPDLQRIFRKQTRMWPTGESVVPVDWDATSPVRADFSDKVMRRSVREMAEFWVQQNITQGLTPPTTLKSTRAVLRFVASVPGAIAYVPADEVDDTVKRLEVKGLL